MIVGLGILFVRLVAVAGLAGNFCCQIVFDKAFPFFKGRCSVNPTRDIMGGGGVASRTSKILPIRSHVNIQLLIRLHHGRIKIAVFNTIPTAAEEMAGPAVFPCGESNTLGNLIPVRRVIGLAVARKHRGFCHRVAGTNRKFFISPCLLVADQAIDPGLICKIKILTFPAVTGMA